MSRKRSHWFAFYVDDWLGGTRRMTAAAKGVFIELLCDQFANGSIPKDEDQIQMIAGVRPDEWAKVRASVLAKFEDDGDGGLVNRRMEREREEREEIRQKRISAGSKGGNKKVANAKANGSVLLVASTSTSTSTSTTSSEAAFSSPTPRGREADDVFNAYAIASDKRSHQRDALAAIHASAAAGETFDDMLDGIERLAPYLAEWPKSEKREFAPNPATFFAGERWKDDPESWISRGNKPTSAGGYTNGGKHSDRSHLAPYMNPDLLAEQAAHTAKFEKEMAEARRRDEQRRENEAKGICE